MGHSSAITVTVRNRPGTDRGHLNTLLKEWVKEAPLEELEGREGLVAGTRKERGIGHKLRNRNNGQKRSSWAIYQASGDVGERRVQGGMGDGSWISDRAFLANPEHLSKEFRRRFLWI